MLQLRDIPLGENSQGDKNLNFMSYLKKSLSISLNKFGLKQCLRLKKLVSKCLSLGLKKSLGISLKNIWP